MKRQRRTRASGALAKNDDGDDDARNPDDDGGMPLEAVGDSMLPPSDGSGGVGRQLVSTRKRSNNDVGAASGNNDAGAGAGGGAGPAAKKTLFSAVMRRSHTSSGGGDDDMAGPSNPPPSKISAQDVTTKNVLSMGTSEANTDGPTDGPPTKAATPLTKPPGGLPRSPFSPGEYGILRAVNDANDQSAYFEKDAGEEGDGNEEQEAPADEWYDATVQFRGSTINGEGAGEWGKSRGDMGTNLTDSMNAEVDSVEAPNLDPLPSSIVEATRHAVDLEGVKQPKGSVCPAPCGIGAMDWSLKNRLRLQCIPGRCLPGSNSSSGGRSEGLVRQLALHYLSTGGGIDSSSFLGRTPTPEELAAAKWQAGTMYHQHPAAHPLPPSLLEESTNAGPKDQSLSGDLSSFVRETRAIHRRVRLPAAGGMGGLGASLSLVSNDKPDRGMGGKRRKPLTATVPSLLDQRRREWRGAFRSMHRAWLAGLRDLEERRGGGCKDGKAPAPDELARCCFYSILPHQVVLFRGGYAGSGVGSPRSAADDVAEEIVPVIVFSSTTPRLRAKLASMGVRLKLATPSEKEGEPHEPFSEDLLRPEEVPTTAGRPAEGDAEVHAELDAIKWADDEKGKVTVNLKKKGPNARGNGMGGADLPPLFVSGHDDCAAVYELLVNTDGFSANVGAELSRNGNSTMAPMDVPLLLCRSLGPCEHTTLRTLTLSGRRHSGHMRQMDANGRPPPPAERASLELRGPILPCALRDMTCAMVHWMMLDKRAGDAGRGAGLRPRYGKHREAAGEGHAGTGSHQFAMFLQAHEGEWPVMAPTSTGSSSSRRFNGSGIPLRPGREKSESTGWHECMHGDTINTLVYDIMREAVVSFRPGMA